MMNRREFLQHGLLKVAAGLSMTGGAIVLSETTDAADRSKRINEMLESEECKDLKPEACLPEELEDAQPEDWVIATGALGGAVLAQWGVAQWIGESVKEEGHAIEQSTEKEGVNVDGLANLISIIPTDKSVHVKARPVAFFTKEPEGMQEWHFGVKLSVLEDESKILAWTRLGLVPIHRNRKDQLSVGNSRDSIQMLVSADKILDTFREMPNVTTSLIGSHDTPLGDEARQQLHENAAWRWIEPIPIHE